jgi:hypothetical protein
MTESAPDERAAARLRAAKVAALLLAVTVAVVAQRLGAFRLASDPERVRQALVDLGPWGYLAFLAVYVVLQPLGIPGMVFVVAAALIWPWPIAFALSMVGSLAASVVGFPFARFVARDWVAERVPARFRCYDEALAKRAFATVFVLRSARSRRCATLPPRRGAAASPARSRSSRVRGSSAVARAARCARSRGPPSLARKCWAAHRSAICQRSTPVPLHHHLAKAIAVLFVEGLARLLAFVERPYRVGKLAYCALPVREWQRMPSAVGLGDHDEIVTARDFHVNPGLTPHDQHVVVAIDVVERESATWEEVFPNR